MDWEALLAEAELRTSRSSGPGGQHANVTASRVEAILDLTTAKHLGDTQRARLIEKLGPRVTAIAQDNRSQLRNRELALERLRGKLERALHVPRTRRPTKPTKGSKLRRLDAKKRQSERKQGRRRGGGDFD